MKKIGYTCDMLAALQNVCCTKYDILPTEIPIVAKKKGSQFYNELKLQRRKTSHQLSV